MIDAPLRRVCIVMMSAVGDAVHVLPVINALKRRRSRLGGWQKRSDSGVRQIVQIEFPRMHFVHQAFLQPSILEHFPVGDAFFVIANALE